MRQLDLTLPIRHRDDLEALLEQYDTRMVRMWGTAGSDTTVCQLSLTNGDVGAFLEDLEQLEDVSVTFAPQSVLTMTPGTGQAPEDLIDVEALSPDEVFLAGLQSVGSWKGFLGYAVVAGAVVWIGLLVGSVFLLIAAMLIAPFAGPAMSSAIATATGAPKLLVRNLVRYLAALATTIAVAAALHALLGGDTATNLMASTANVSEVAVMLPLVAGAAGALNLMQAERSSLVSGAATGVLVAAALAPPAGLVGMALVIGDLSMVKAGLFLLALQLAGLNVSGTIVFRLYGLNPGNARYGRGHAWIANAVLAASALTVAGLVSWQLADPPSLQRETIQAEISAALPGVLADDPDAVLVESNVRFTRPEIAGQNTVLAVIYVQANGGAAPSEVEDRLEAELSRAITERFSVTALVDVTALPPPG